MILKQPSYKRDNFDFDANIIQKLLFEKDPSKEISSHMQISLLKYYLPKAIESILMSLRIISKTIKYIFSFIPNNEVLQNSIYSQKTIQEIENIITILINCNEITNKKLSLDIDFKNLRILIQSFLRIDPNNVNEFAVPSYGSNKSIKNKSGNIDQNSSDCNISVISPIEEETNSHLKINTNDISVSLDDSILDKYSTKNLKKFINSMHDNSKENKAKEFEFYSIFNLSICRNCMLSPMQNTTSACLKKEKETMESSALFSPKNNYTNSFCENTKLGNSGSISISIPIDKSNSISNKENISISELKRESIFKCLDYIPEIEESLESSFAYYENTNKTQNKFNKHLNPETRNKYTKATVTDTLKSSREILKQSEEKKCKTAKIIESPSKEPITFRNKEERKIILDENTRNENLPIKNILEKIEKNKIELKKLRQKEEKIKRILIDFEKNPNIIRDRSISMQGGIFNMSKDKSEISFKIDALEKENKMLLLKARSQSNFKNKSKPSLVQKQLMRKIEGKLEEILRSKKIMNTINSGL